MFLDRPFGRGAIAVGNGRLPDMRLAALAAVALVFIGADVDQFGAMAVIGPVEDDHVVRLGLGPHHAQHQVIGLAAGADEARRP